MYLISVLHDTSGIRYQVSAAFIDVSGLALTSGFGSIRTFIVNLSRDEDEK
jgi:hypothetical protein